MLGNNNDILDAARRIPRVRAALNRRGQALGTVADVNPFTLRITIRDPAREVTAVSVSAAWDFQGDLYAETALIGPDGLQYNEELGYEEGIQRFFTEDEFFAELERLHGLLVQTA